ncbi:MAG: hypothetical protein IPG76_18130 [Acidobacteria bacterium]|nr:hypothetical protein [Acidobacteriota bacterium]
MDQSPTDENSNQCHPPIAGGIDSYDWLKQKFQSELHDLGSQLETFARGDAQELVTLEIGSGGDRRIRIGEIC